MIDKLDIFNKEFRDLYRDIYYLRNNADIIDNTIKLFNFVIINKNIIQNNTYKNNIKIILEKELKNINNLNLNEIYKFYLEVIFDKDYDYDIDYDIL
jgi:hypothetical protein